jgi:hypothetical protein
VTVDEAELRRSAQGASTDLLKRAGLTVPHRWPLIPAH